MHINYLITNLEFSAYGLFYILRFFALSIMGFFALSIMGFFALSIMGFFALFIMGFFAHAFIVQVVSMG